LESEYTSVIQLELLPSIGLLVLCLFLILKAYPEIATGIYLAIFSWGHTLKIGNIAQTWILLTTMFGAAFIFYNKKRDSYLPKNDRWIIPWVSFWWFWSLILLFFSGTLENHNIGLSFILSTILPIPVILLYSHRINNIMSFSIAYILTTMMGGLILLQYTNANYPALLINPLTGNYGMGRLPIGNYHSFSYPYGISIIMLIALLQQTKSLIARVTCSCAIVYCLYFLFFSASRQTILATLIVCILFLFWFSTKVEEVKRFNYYRMIRAILIIAVIGFSVYFFFEGSPITIFRDIHAEGLWGFHDIATEERRWGTWAEARQQILGSYFLGTVYEAGNVHNIFLSVLANEGIVGFILMLGFFIFFFKQIRNVWFVKVIDDVAIWRMAFFCIFLSTLIHSQISGDNISAPEFFWSVIFLWYSKGHSSAILSRAEK